MIWESQPWKNDLLARAIWLRKSSIPRVGSSEQREWSEEECVKAEQCVLIGCYCIRKLMESRKLTDATQGQIIPVTTHKPTGAAVHSMNWHHLEQLYDLQNENRETRPLEFICNQLIHSFVFVLGFNKAGGLNHIFFSSDRERDKNLFRISIADLAKAIESVGSDELAKLELG